MAVVVGVVGVGVGVRWCGGVGGKGFGGPVGGGHGGGGVHGGGVVGMGVGVWSMVLVGRGMVVVGLLLGHHHHPSHSHDH